MNILPGEPVPPGFEDEVNRVAEIQQAIDQYKGNALVGLEYTVELYEENREPGYICLLCDKRGDPRTVMQHWTSFNHRMKYLSKHFPTLVREFNPVKYKPNSNSIMIIIVQSLAEAIEDHHGRLTLSVVSSEDFRRERKRIESEINVKFHFDERNGPNFLNIIDRTLWESKPNNETAKKPVDKTLKITLNANTTKRSVDDRPSQRQDLDEISSEDEVNPTDAGGKKSKKEVQLPAYRTLPRVRRSPPFEEERNTIESKANDKKLPTPKELSLQASHIAQERYKWEKYRCMLEIQLKQMEKIQQDYEKNPEKHPLYPEEWKKFWNRRYKELQNEKSIDPNKYDYKPEWILFWTKRMQDLFNDEVDKKKKEIKVKLGLPENAEEKVEQLKEKYKVQVQNRNVSTAIAAPTTSTSGLSKASERINKIQPTHNSRSSTAVIDISDSDSEDSKRRHSKSRSHSRRSRSISPHSRRESKRSRARSRSRSRSPRSDDHHERHFNKLREREAYERERHMHMVPGTMRMYPSTASADYYGIPPPFGRSRFPPPPHYPGAPPPHASGYRIMDPQQYPQYERSPSPNLKQKREEHQAKKASPEPEEDGPLTVVAVLRLLTALEEHLGSLGPKVVDMLGKALALEKVKANSADEMLINDDNSVFFETIKEKLKGLLIADVLEDPQKVRAVKRAIKNIAAIVHQVNSKGITTNKSGEHTDDTQGEDGSSILNKNKNQTPTIKDLPFDRQIVSTKLAAALVMQGREDVSTEDMDKLIYVFILMTKLSKDKAEIDESPLYTKDMLPELGITVPQPAIPAATVSLASMTIPAIVDDFLENEVNALVQEVEDEISNDINEKSSKNDPNASMLESLTDSDLQTLLQNFKHLSTEEQHHLIAHLKKLESADPARVEKLRKFVNLAELADAAAASTSATASASKASTSANKSRNIDSVYDEGDSSSNTRFKRYNDNDDEDNASNSDRYNFSGTAADEASERRRGANITNPNKFSLDDEDDEDDYNFDDVFKVASNNVKNLSEERKSETKSAASSSLSNAGGRAADSNAIASISTVSSVNALTFNPAGLNISLSDTQNIIANLMGSLQQSNNSSTITPSNNNTAQEPLSSQAPVNKQQSASFPQQNSLPFYQQHQQQQQQPQQQQNQGFAGGFQQMNNVSDPQAAYYNQAGGYNNAPGFPGYQQWGNTQQMQGYGMQNFMGQQQPQQHPQPSHQMGYNMYGHGN